jgi:hypothetical protein
MTKTEMTFKVFPGLWWAQPTGQDYYVLVEVRDASYRPDDWFKPNEPKVEIFSMGWDCSEHVSNYTFFVKADLTTPDGKRYK